MQVYGDLEGYAILKNEYFDERGDGSCRKQEITVYALLLDIEKALTHIAGLVP